MRIFRFWVELTKEINIDGQKQLSKALGGSNLSKEDALQDAENRLLKVQEMANNGFERGTDYEVDIVEEIIEQIDEKNIVTRNRYGALVLNTKHLQFIDIDSYSKSLIDILFRKELSLKELMLRKIEKTIQSYKQTNLGFRIYETAKGYRVLVTNKDFEAKSRSSKKMMKDFKADRLYRRLCVRQNCYRARLTPKPFRIKQKGIRVIFPNRNAEQQQKLDDWVKEYKQKSINFSSCHLIKQYGKIEINAAIEYHDRLTGIQYKNKLA